MTPSSSSSSWPPSSNSFVRGLLGVPSFHNSVYQKDPHYTYADWHAYRSPARRFGPEPLLCLRVASGYWQPLLVNILFSIFVVMYFVFLVPLGAPDFANKIGSLFTMATFGIALLLAFKVNQAHMVLTRRTALLAVTVCCILTDSYLGYSRWWAARTNVGSMLGALRTILRMVTVWCGEDSQHVVDAAARWVPAAMLLLKHHVRHNDDGLAQCRELLTPADFAFLETFANKPLGAAHAMGRIASQATDQPILQAQIHEQIAIYLVLTAGCERIYRTPIPKGYARFTSRAVMSYIVIVPLLLWPATGYITPLIAGFVAFMVLGIDNVTVQIEEPFRVLHLESLCAAVLAAAKELQPWNGGVVAKAFQRQLTAAAVAPSVVPSPPPPVAAVSPRNGVEPSAQQRQRAQKDV